MLSKRLETVAGMVTPGYIVADIGTDHGYVPIYLIKNNIVPYAYAMDVNEGPINAAMRNVAIEGVSDKISVVKSDGMEKLKEGDAESVIIAGMGGELIVDILKKSKVNHTLKELVLSPHRDLDLVRKHIHNMGWRILDEKMIIDSEKYYVVIKAIPGKEDAYTELEYKFGKKLLDRKDDVLRGYLLERQRKFVSVKADMQKRGNNNIENIDEIIESFEKGLEKYD